MNLAKNLINGDHDAKIGNIVDKEISMNGD